MSMPGRGRKSVLLAGCFIAMYVSCFVLASTCGAYVTDGLVDTWHPKGCWVRAREKDDCWGGNFKRTLAGWLFYPLAKADEFWWHKSHLLMGGCF